MIVRCTARVTQTLKLGRLGDTPRTPDDWYVNSVTLGRRRVMLAVHADTLFPIVAVGASVTQLRNLPTWLSAQVAQALAEEGLPPSQLGALDPEHALLVRTASRKVLGQLNQLAHEVEWLVQDHRGWEGIDLVELNRSLRRALRGRDGDYVVPLELARHRTVNPGQDAVVAQFTAQLQGASVDELREVAAKLLTIAAERAPFGGRVAADRASAPVEVLQVEASLLGADPPISREVEIPATATLEHLHHLLQRAFGWHDSHLYRFARGGSVWGGDGAQLWVTPYELGEAEPEDPPAAPLLETRLTAVFVDVGDELRYLYDYGDHWEVGLTVTGVRRGPRTRAAITGGRGAAPPDDVGGIDHWNEVRPRGDEPRTPTGLVALGVLRRRRT